MRFVYPAQFRSAGPDEVVVSFRDLPECLTSGSDEAEALLEAQDALEEAIAGRIDDDQSIPEPSSPVPGERMIAVPAEMAAKAALALAFRTSRLTRTALAERLGVQDKVVRQMLDPRHGTSVSSINEALGLLGNEIILEMRKATARVAASG